MDIAAEKGGVLKTIIKEGTGEKAEQGKLVFVHYVGTFEDGKKFDSSRDREELFSFVLGQEQVIKGWEIAVSTMKVGERAEYKIRYDYAYGENDYGPIKGKSTLCFDIEFVKQEENKGSSCILS